MKRDETFGVVSEHVILMCREYAKSNSITKAAQAGGFSNDEVMLLLSKPEVVDTLHDEIKSRADAAKASKATLTSRLNIISEAIMISVNDALNNPEEKKKVSKEAIDILTKCTDIIAKLNGFYKDDEAKAENLEDMQKLINARKRINWDPDGLSINKPNI